MYGEIDLSGIARGERVALPEIWRKHEEDACFLDAQQTSLLRQAEHALMTLKRAMKDRADPDRLIELSRAYLAARLAFRVAMRLEAVNEDLKSL